MVFNATFNNISAILVDETRVPGENHQPAASHYLKPHQEVKTNLDGMIHERSPF
jgi:hypothetical protein